MKSATSSQTSSRPPAAGKPRPRLLIRLGRIGCPLLALPLVLVIASAANHALAGAFDGRNYPPPGELVDVGGYRLHLYCMGEGSPTVILDAANQGTVSNWVWIQPELAKTTRVCAYDRAGLGWSDLTSAPQDTRQNAHALKTLLDNAGEPGPYVLVGHSFGCLFVRMFADLYPDQVAGIAFIEGTLPDGLKALGQPDVMPGAPDAGFMDATPFISRLGILRVMGFPPTDPDLPERQRNELKAYLASTKWAEAIKQQYHLFPDLLAQVRPLYEPGSLGDMPLAVVLGSEGDGGIEAWQELFEQQAALSTNGRIYRIEGATHISLVDRQEHAAQTLIAILDVVEAAGNE